MEGAKSIRPFAHCSINFITNLLMIQGFDSLLVMVNQGLSKGIILIPCNKPITEEGMGKLLLENLYIRLRLLDKLLSD